MNLITLGGLSKALPANLKQSATQDLVDKLNSISSDPIVSANIRDNFISYTRVLQSGKFRTEDYLNAVQYVSYKLMGDTNKDAYFRTFPQRYQTLLAKGTSDKDISSYVSAYNNNKLVNLILEQTLVPSWVLNQDLYQKALGVQAELMTSAYSEKVRCDAANSLLSHLTKPKETGPLLNIDLRESSGMTELKEAMKALAQKQLDVLSKGGTVKQIAEHNIMDITDIDESS